jgi:hypothetical protein
LCNEELPNVYPSPSIIRMMKLSRMRWVGHVARMGRRVTHVGYWWENAERRPKRRWVNNIKMELGEGRLGGRRDSLDWCSSG